MDDTEDLARRFLALWGEYLTAQAGDPQILDMWRRVLAPDTEPAAPGESTTTGSSARATSAADASGERDDALAELARRVGELERRIAAIEPVKPRRRPAASVGRRIRAARPDDA